jgi:hypothetical protein
MDAIALIIRSIVVSILTVGSAEPETSSDKSSMAQVRQRSGGDTQSLPFDERG